MSDLIQEGLWGLERGLREYDPSRQAKVSTAVYWYIRDAVFKAKRLESNVIHVPLTTQEQIAKLRSATQRWQRQHPNQAPTATQLKELTDMGRHGTLKRVIQASLRSERSLDLPVSQGHFSGFSSDKSISWVDKLAYDDFRDDHEFQHDLKSALALLPDPMGVIVQEKYGLRDGYAKNYAEVGSPCPAVQLWHDFFQHLHCISAFCCCVADHIQCIF